MKPASLFSFNYWGRRGGKANQNCQITARGVEGQGAKAKSAEPSSKSKIENQLAYTSGFTTLGGLRPSSAASRFSAASMAILSLVSPVPLPTWGIRTTLGISTSA